MSLIPAPYVSLGYTPSASFGSVDITAGNDGTYRGYSLNDYSFGSKGADTLCTLNGGGVLTELYYLISSPLSDNLFEMSFNSNADAITALADMQALYTNVSLFFGFFKFQTSGMAVSGSTIYGSASDIVTLTDGNTYTVEWT